MPILVRLQYLYSDSKLRRKAVQLVAAEINETSRRDFERPRMDQWYVVVMTAVRLGCNLHYDNLEDRVENHRVLSGITGIGESSLRSQFVDHLLLDTLLEENLGQEPLTFGFTLCRKKDAEPSFSVVTFGGDHKSRPTFRLFMDGDWIQRNPDIVPSVWNAVLRFPFQSTTARPTSFPKSISPCNWEDLQAFSSTPRLSLCDLSGRTISSPS